MQTLEAELVKFDHFIKKVKEQKAFGMVRQARVKKKNRDDLTGSRQESKTEKNTKTGSEAERYFKIKQKKNIRKPQDHDNNFRAG